jgi:hypothetical protein
MATTSEKTQLFKQKAKVAIPFFLHQGKDPVYELKGPIHDEIGRWKLGARHR